MEVPTVFSRYNISIIAGCANFVCFRGSQPLLVGVCGVYSESP